MPSPCTPWASHSYGPVRVQLSLTAPEGYEEQHNQSDVGPPYSVMSEIAEALHTAVDTRLPDITVHVADLDPNSVRVPRTATVYVGGGAHIEPRALERTGPSPQESLQANTPMSEPAEAPETASYQATWNVELCVYAPDPPTADIGDYAEIARLWMAGITEIMVRSGAILSVSPDSGWILGGGSWNPLPAGYPESVGRGITIVAAP